MSQKLEEFIESAIAKLDQALDQISKTKKFTLEKAQALLLKELVKEQAPNENSHYPAGQAR